MTCRVGQLELVGMPGGAAAIREPWRMALAHLDAAFGGDLPDGLDVRARQGGRWDAVGAVLHAGVNSPATSSMGRLLDAVAAILGVRDATTYEGQAAIELEQLADPTEHAVYPVSLAGEEPFRIQGGDLVRAAVEDLARGAAGPASRPVCTRPWPRWWSPPAAASGRRGVSPRSRCRAGSSRTRC